MEPTLALIIIAANVVGFGLFMWAIVSVIK
jgi:hypothetical protein